MTEGSPAYGREMNTSASLRKRMGDRFFQETGERYVKG